MYYLERGGQGDIQTRGVGEEETTNPRVARVKHCSDYRVGLEEKLSV
ncbi:hypothetical protein [Chlorogloeopsis sp. ULAP02]